MAAGAQLVEERFGQARGDSQLQAFHDEPGEGRQDTGAEKFGRAGQMDGCGLAVGSVLGPGRGGEYVEGYGDTGGEVVGPGGRGGSARETLEEFAAHLPFQSTDLGGHRGLREAQEPGGGGERAGTVDRQEGAQQIQIRHRRRT